MFLLPRSRAFCDRFAVAEHMIAGSKGMTANLFTASPKSAAYGSEALPPADDEARSTTEIAGLRHRATVRATHWAMVVGVLGLLASGFGILISHPRLYWGETGAIGTPS